MGLRGRLLVDQRLGSSQDIPKQLNPDPSRRRRTSSGRRPRWGGWALRSPVPEEVAEQCVALAGHLLRPVAYCCVDNWISQLKSEGILDSTTTAPVEESVPQVSAPTETVDDPSHAVAELEQENAKLRELLEDSSRLLDETITVQGSSSDGYAPHYNARTGKTMWISPNGRSCYYTVDPPTSNLSP